MRLIDANKLMAEENAAFTRAQYTLGRQNGKQLSRALIEAQITINQIVHAKLHSLIQDTPTVDAVEVVRCKDCDNTDIPVDEEDEHDYWCMIHGSYVYEDDFCSYGERRHK